VTPEENKQSKVPKAKRRCRQGSKSVLGVCVKPLAVVEMPITRVLQDDLGYARDYLMVLPQRIKEVQQAANAVLKAGRTL
jgi:hypothetical protein